MSDSRLEKFIYAICSMDVSDLPVPLSRIEKLWNCLITGETPDFEPLSRNEKYLMAMLDRYDISNLPAPMSRGEKLLYKIAVGETDLSDVPGYLSRYEELLKYLIENGENGENSEDDFEYVLYTLNQSLHTLYLTAEKPVKKAIVYGDTLVNTLQESSSLSVTPMGEAIDTQQATITGTANGAIKSAILKGNTLVNVVSSYAFGGDSMLYESRFYDKPFNTGETFTIFVVNPKVTTIKVGVFNAKTGAWVREDEYNVSDNKKIVYTVPSNALCTYVGVRVNTYLDSTGFENSLVIVSGDKSNLEIENYFEGMQSVKMPVLTTTGKNLWNEKDWSKGLTSSTGVVQTGGTYDGFRYNNELISVNGYDKIYCRTFAELDGVSGNSCRVAEYDLNKTFLRMILSNSPYYTPSNDCKYIRVHFDLRYNPNATVPTDDIPTYGVVATEPITSYEPYKSNILTVNEPIELRGIGEGSNRVEDELDCLTGEVVERIGVGNIENFKNVQYSNILFDGYYSSIIDLYNKKQDSVISTNLVPTNEFGNCDYGIYNNPGNVVLFKKGATLDEMKELINQLEIQYELEQKSIKTVDLTVVDQDGNTVPHLQAFNETTHISTSSEGLIPNVVIPATVSYPSIIKPSTLYTVKLKRSVTSGTLMINVGGTEQAVTSDCFTMTTPSTLTSQDVIFSGKGNVISEVTVVEGDQTSKEYGYFEGMQSVKMPVLTTTGKNIFSPTKMIINDGATYGYYKHKDDESVRCTLSISDKDTSVDISGIYFGMSKSGKNANDGIEWLISNGSVTQPNTLSFTTNRNFISIYPNNTETLNKLTKRFNIQLEYGEVKTTYEPYKTNILSTPSDSELRGIGEGSNRVEDELDLLTGEVTERISEIVLDGKNDVKISISGKSSDYPSIVRFWLRDGELSNLLIHSGERIMCDKLPVRADGDYEKITASNGFDIHITASKLSEETVEAFKEYLSQNPITVQYPLNVASVKTVDLTVVDQDNQPTQLGTFENVTNVSLEAENLIPEVEMEVATNLLEDTVFNLTDAFNTLYPTAAKPVKSAILSGNTLVNLFKNKVTRRDTGKFIYVEEGDKIQVTFKDGVTNGWMGFSFKENIPFEIGKTYTVMNELYKCDDQLGGFNISLGNKTFVNTKPVIGINKLKIIIPSDYTEGINWMYYNVNNTNNSATIFSSNLLILEGDYTQEDIPYFEGMQSVKMPVLTTTGKNLFNIHMSNKSDFLPNTFAYRTSETIQLKPNTHYTLSAVMKDYIGGLKVLAVGDGSVWVDPLQTTRIFARTDYNTAGVRTYTFTTTETGLFNLWYYDQDNRYNVSDFLESIQLEEGSVATSYEPHKSNILSTTEDVTLRGIGQGSNRVEDELDCLTGEVTERIGEVVLDGSQNLSITQTGENTIRYQYVFNDKSYGFTNVVSDILPTINVFGSDVECISGVNNNSNILFRLSKEKATNVQECKQYLQQNPITVHYERIIPTVKTVDLTVVDQDGNETKLGTFDDTTHVLLNSEGLVPEATLTVRTKIPSASSTSLLMDDISTKQERLNTMVDEQSNNVDATMIATTEIFEEIL